MSVGQIVLLAITAGLSGVIVGAVLIAVVITRYQRTAQARRRLIDAQVRWLAARMSLTRASGSVVAAFRALAAERRDSAYLSLRSTEAQRARSGWCDAMRELDLVEAELTLVDPAGATRQHLARFPRVASDALRRTINGSEADVDQFLRDLRAADERAINVGRAVAADTLAPRWRYWDRLLHIVRRLESVVDQWSLRAGAVPLTSQESQSGCGRDRPVRGLKDEVDHRAGKRGNSVD